RRAWLRLDRHGRRQDGRRRGRFRQTQTGAGQQSSHGAEQRSSHGSSLMAAGGWAVCSDQRNAASAVSALLNFYRNNAAESEKEGEDTRKAKGRPVNYLRAAGRV